MTPRNSVVAAGEVTHRIVSARVDGNSFRYPGSQYTTNYITDAKQSGELLFNHTNTAPIAIKPKRP